MSMVVAPPEYYCQPVCHYVYRISNVYTGMHYYGVKTKKLNKNGTKHIGVIGIDYFSSSKLKWFKDDQKLNPQNYKYKVVRVFGSRELAVDFEVFLHAKFDVKNHSKFINNANQSSSGFDFNSTGYAAAKCVNTGKSLGRISKDDPRWGTGEIVGTSKGKNIGTIPAKCVNTGKSLGRISKDDPRWGTGEIVTSSKGAPGTAVAKCSTSGKNLGRISKDDPRWGTGEIVGNTIGRTVAYCSEGGMLLGSVPLDDPRWGTGEIVGPGATIIWISNGTETRKYVPDGTDIISDGWYISRVFGTNSSKLVNIYSRETGELMFSNVSPAQFGERFGYDKSGLTRCARLNQDLSKKKIRLGEPYYHKDIVVKYVEMSPIVNKLNRTDTIQHIVISNGVETRKYIPDGTDSIPDGWTVVEDNLNYNAKLLDIFDRESNQLLYSFVTATGFSNRFKFNQSSLNKCARLNSLEDGKVYTYKKFIVRYSDMSKLKETINRNVNGFTIAHNL